MADGLGKRILTAVVLVAATLATLFLFPEWVTWAAVSALALAGAWEWSAFLQLTSPAGRAAYVLLIAALLWGAWQVSLTPRGRDLLLAGAVAWWLVALGWVLFAPRRAAPWSAGLAGALALVPCWLALVRLRSAPQGADWVLYALALVWVADIGAFFFGRQFGRLQLAPHVSPRKTWEGVL
ncbi:MAG: phosphatidate cytidylyltransferase, partial [Gammaproteobacteria bacterium]|nr:phosphatidate cytidylyltransferase [Gammaproteobacteria bacterium]